MSWNVNLNKVLCELCPKRNGDGRCGEKSISKCETLKKMEAAAKKDIKNWITKFCLKEGI